MSKDIELCSICRDPMDGTILDYMLRCNHRFHVECIVDSLRRQRECPICRDTGFDNTVGQNDDMAYDGEVFWTPFSQFNKYENPDSEIYATYQMIKSIGKNQYRELYLELKQASTYQTSLENMLLKDYRKKMVRLQEEMKINRNRITRELGFSPIYLKMKENGKLVQQTASKLRNAIKNDFVDMGYEKNDKELNDLINGYLKVIKKHKDWKHWQLNRVIRDIPRYTLPKYADLDKEPVEVINNINYQLTI